MGLFHTEAFCCPYPRYSINPTELWFLLIVDKVAGQTMVLGRLHGFTPSKRALFHSLYLSLSLSLSPCPSSSHLLHSPVVSGPVLIRSLYPSIFSITTGPVVRMIAVFHSFFHSIGANQQSSRSPELGLGPPSSGPPPPDDLSVESRRRRSSLLLPY
ncbi:unnamed protein product [Protopolystoma xenopodis]|uniref:Uncharacterized protein n=1 Tax=Protopolystoma xenopodis TaxID=117903 RepID=A0A448WHL4_9PLAT|nr:unnamed protein product [Protopolystoma xenopodis]